jgi:hypothetical protein
MRVKHTFVRSVANAPGVTPTRKRETYEEAVEVADGSRFYHVRAPLVLRQFVGNKEVMPAVVPELANYNGGCTILISPHDDEYVAVRVGWCRFTDNYCRGVGRITAARKDPTLVKRENLEDELLEIEEQMLISSAWPLRHDPALLADCKSDWSRTVRRYYEPKEEKVAVS